MAKNNLQQSLFPLEEMEQEAIAFLRENEPAEGYFVGFSGGKDSICCLHLCKLAGVKHQAFYSCTRIDPPEVVRMIRQHYHEVTFLYPEMTFWEGIKKKSPPLRMKRWCCDVLKKQADTRCDLLHKVFGQRKEESAKRASRPRIDKYKKKAIWYKPIFEWSEWHVWEFIEKYGLVYPSLYDEGFNRIGCVICPFVFHKTPNAQKRLAQAKERWPGMFKTFEKVCREWFENKVANGLGENRRYETFEEYMEAYYRGFE
jgi:phosphoadenosine phosphosulfate reductase